MNISYRLQKALLSIPFFMVWFFLIFQQVQGENKNSSDIWYEKQSSGYLPIVLSARANHLNPTVTLERTSTGVPSITGTPTATPNSPTQTATTTRNPTKTPTLPPTRTPTPTNTQTPSASPTAIKTNTPTPTQPAAIGGYYFPPAGQTLDQQNLKLPSEVGLNPNLISLLEGKASRWALWRHGYLVHIEGDFNRVQEVKSLRKTWHAMTVGAAIQQGLLPSYNAKITNYVSGLQGNDRLASFKDVMIQSAGFDYPGCGISIDYLPGEMWTYSDYNPYYLNLALAKVYDKPYTTNGYISLLKEAYFDEIGMQGWSAVKNTSDLGGLGDGIRLSLDLEDMGRLGLLALTGGNWAGNQVIPQWFVQELQVKQTSGMLVNYDGCNNGVLPYLKTPGFPFPESPYGYMTWTNSARDYYPGADPGWAWGFGAGGFYVLWNQQNGIVYAGVGVDNFPKSNGGIPHIIEANITGPNPLH